MARFGIPGVITAGKGLGMYSDICQYSRFRADLKLISSIGEKHSIGIFLIATGSKLERQVGLVHGGGPLAIS